MEQMPHGGKQEGMMEAGAAPERRELESGLNVNELILNSAGEGIYGLDGQGCATFVNPAAARMAGHEVEELIGRPLHPILHHSKPDGKPYLREECPIFAALKDGAIHRVTGEVFWRQDGTSFPVEYVSTPIRERGRIVGAVVIFRDIAERKRAEEALRARAQAFRVLHELAVATGGVLDPAALARLVVDRARDLLGANSAGLFWWDPEAALLRPLGENDPELAALDRQLSPGQGVSGLAFQRGQTVVVQDYAAWEHAVPWGMSRGIRSAAAVPLLVNDRPLGALGVRSYVPRHFGPEQVQLLALFAAQVGPALEA
ncbi:MAG: GAF domain-containing protein, partial [Chloroflexi bacterium]|nr:GAF domain-containing protein [Chloroflexota bacterium]